MELNNNQQENEQMPTQLQPQVIYRAEGWVAVIAGQMGEKMDGLGFCSQGAEYSSQRT